jgi:hypothetical protein
MNLNTTNAETEKGSWRAMEILCLNRILEYTYNICVIQTYVIFSCIFFEIIISIALLRAYFGVFPRLHVAHVFLDYSFKFASLWQNLPCMCFFQISRETRLYTNSNCNRKVHVVRVLNLQVMESNVTYREYIN